MEPASTWARGDHLAACKEWFRGLSSSRTGGAGAARTQDGSRGGRGHPLAAAVGVAIHWGPWGGVVSAAVGVAIPWGPGEGWDHGRRGGAESPGRGGGGRGSSEGYDGEPVRGAVAEQLVLVELSGIIDSDFLSKCENKCKILGIDTERPILQVDSYVFAGEYEDTLGTCVIFEENVEHVDAEGNNKTVLKYKCHTMKKLSMTRTLLTEKKEGEESIGGVEWLQIEDNDFSNRPNMICNFLHENEDEEVVAPAPDKPLELEEQNIQMKFNSNLSYEQEKPPHLEVEDSGPLIDTPSETESSVFMETQDAALEITPR
ncbi:general transcription factor 3C polypeptide 6 isoform X1 [Myotis myotis]|uniref:general transcription factor 3C polypeptide 6 isoform X1 n=1 Tax=Myotis myotis TaxID=51298 RepID=UPI00174DD86E|nr:general transcription factor 3C polypeptide 6 isoform X1 [Myotis myotis]